MDPWQQYRQECLRAGTEAELLQKTREFFAACRVANITLNREKWIALIAECKVAIQAKEALQPHNVPPVEVSQQPIEVNRPPVEVFQPPIQPIVASQPTVVFQPIVAIQPDNVPPIEESQPPIEDSQPPIEDSQPPIEVNQPPIKVFQPPSVTCQPTAASQPNNVPPIEVYQTPIEIFQPTVALQTPIVDLQPPIVAFKTFMAPAFAGAPLKVPKTLEAPNVGARFEQKVSNIIAQRARRPAGIG